MMKQAKLWTNKYFVALSATIACVLWGSAFPVFENYVRRVGAYRYYGKSSRVGRFLLAALLCLHY